MQTALIRAYGEATAKVFLLKELTQVGRHCLIKSVESVKQSLEA